MRTIRILMVCQLWLVVIGTLLAEDVTLKDGSRVTGTIQAGGKTILIVVNGEPQVIAIDQIVSIDFNPPLPPAESGPAVTAVPTPPPALPVIPAPEPVPAQPIVAVTPGTPAAPGAAHTITVPAGTEIAVRTIDAIDSKKASKSQEYRASLDDPLVVNGVTIAPVNTPVILRVTEAHNPVGGRASLSTTLVAITINGQRINLGTDPVKSDRGVQAKRTAIGAGAGAAAGAGVGAATAGGIGAAVGAAAGAIGGAVAAAATAKGVEVPSETRFTYKLAQPITVPVLEASK